MRVLKLNRDFLVVEVLYSLFLGKKPLAKTNGISYYKTNDISL